MVVTKSSLSPRRRRLIERMQRVNYGRILNLEIQGGEPSFTTKTRIERQIKFGGDCHRLVTAAEDFALKDKVVELLDCFDRMGNGTIIQLEIKGGLPFGMTVEEQAP